MNLSQATLSKMDPYREGAPEDQKLLLCIKLNLTKNWLFVAQTSMKIEEINGKNMDLFFKNYIIIKIIIYGGSLLEREL